VLLSKETRDLVDVEVTDVGEHRLKDFEGRVWIFQLGSARFPPLKTISNTNLPRPASSFVGRAKELEDVAALLQDGARLLTLTGPGGSGKTRLALEAAAALVPEFRNGVFWVGLAPLRDPALVLETVAQTLGAKNGLTEHIAERELLLLLDNMEQVVDAARELALLVETCPSLRVLVTSRELLRVRGEVEYPVLPLAEPEAVELFCTRAQTEPDGTVHELCRRVDNLPLALELAAARASVLSPGQILERLSTRLDLLKGGRDADPRQQTLRATIAWSYELLTPEEQRLFARLAVFGGGCAIEAAEDVAEADLDTLQSLVDKSLLRHTDERFWMLETIREYAAELLDASGERESAARRHRDFFLALAEEAEPRLRGAPGPWLDRLELEHDNVRAALDRLEAAGEGVLLQRLAGALWRFWYLRGHLAEGRRWLERALAAEDESTPARAKALLGATVMAANTGDAATATARAEEAIVSHKALGDPWGAAYATFMLGNLADERNDARLLYERARSTFRELGDEHTELLVTRHLAFACEDLGDHELARALHEENLARARATGNERIEASSLGALAEEALAEGRAEQALALLLESLRIHREAGDVLDTSVDLCRLAAAAAMLGDAGTAARLLAGFEALGDQIGGRRAWMADLNERTLELIHERLDDDVFAGAWAEGLELDLDQAVDLALGVEL
jgi:predicted ATPase